MKKTLLVLFLFMSVIFLTACFQNQATPSTENTMVINMKNSANFSINFFEIYTTFGGGGMGYADGSRIKKGDIFSKVYVDREDLALTGTEQFDFFAIGEDQQRTYLGSKRLDLKRNHSYHFEVTGRNTEEANITLIENND